MLTSELEPSPARLWPSAEVICESGISAEIFNFVLIAFQSSEQTYAPLLPPVKLRHPNHAHGICTLGRQFVGHLYTGDFIYLRSITPMP